MTKIKLTIYFIDFLVSFIQSRIFSLSHFVAVQGKEPLFSARVIMRAQ